MIDTLFADFKDRLNIAKKYKSSTFIPAIAIHSPYSVHPFLVRETLNLARAENLPVSSHFLESYEEFEWLHKDEGSFVEFFQKLFKSRKSCNKTNGIFKSFFKY